MNRKRLTMSGIEDMIDRFEENTGIHPNKLYMQPGQYLKLRDEYGYFMDDTFRGLQIVINGNHTGVVYQPW